MQKSDFRSLAMYLLPAVISGAVTLALFTLIGATPFIRAAGLALVIAAMTLTLRRLGAWLAVSGGLALAFTPAFWSQTGGPPSGAPIMALVLGLTVGCALLARRFGGRALLAVEIALLAGTVIFWRDFTYYNSLRITTLCAALVLLALMDGLLRSNPRPGEAPPAPLDDIHTMGLLLVFSIGVINEPLFLLFAPAIVLGLLLARSKIPLWYWGFWALAIALAVFGWFFPGTGSNTRAPLLLLDGWRAAERWIMLIQLIVAQFTPIGVLLGVLGLARLARWYPPLGVVTMVAYAAYVLFGLVYVGEDKAVLLLPLLMIQALWMTYAVYSFGEWLQKAFGQPRARWVAPAAFMLLPLALLLQAVG
ncbi:MAG: hypothetical protein HXY40_03990 [Chloroflexi bacterium]|nr:hypothetical protein [Chloroflexota bacterium]